MLIKVKDKEGIVYTNDMGENNIHSIIEMHFSTSYTQVIVQDIVEYKNGNKRYPTKDIIIPLENPNWVDMITVNDDEIGEWV